MRVLFAITVALLMTGPAFAQNFTNSGTNTVDNSFWIPELKWGNGQRMMDLAMHFSAADDGSIVVCAATKLRGSVHGLNRKALAAIAIEVDGKRIVRDMRWAPVSKSATTVIGTEAACRNYPRAQFNENTQIRYTFTQRRISG